jgi:hypothetical protein
VGALEARVQLSEFNRRGYYAGIRVTKRNKATVLLTLTLFQTPTLTLTLLQVFVSKPILKKSVLTKCHSEVSELTFPEFNMAGSFVFYLSGRGEFCTLRVKQHKIAKCESRLFPNLYFESNSQYKLHQTVQ